MNYAGADKRAFAGLIDALIVYVSFFILAVIISRTIGESVLILFLMLLAVAAYTPLMCASKYQATVGMRLFKLRMANIDGAPVTLQQSLIRSALELVFFIIAGVGVLYFLVFNFMIERSSSGQTLHDKVANTVILAD